MELWVYQRKQTEVGALLERAVLAWYMLKVFIQFYTLLHRRENVGFEFCRFSDLGKDCTHDDDP